jgi:hypothetical protein
VAPLPMAERSAEKDGLSSSPMAHSSPSMMQFGSRSAADERRGKRAQMREHERLLRMLLASVHGEAELMLLAIPARLQDKLLRPLLSGLQPVGNHLTAIGLP